MKKQTLLIIAYLVALTACNKPSRLEQYRAEKYTRDSSALAEQQRSIIYYQSLLDSLLPISDSLLSMFKYEKNETYQDYGYFLATGQNDLRIKVRDDGEELVVYQHGKRIQPADIIESKKNADCLQQAQHLQVVILDIRELETRIARTSLEVQKYQKRLQKKK